MLITSFSFVMSIISTSILIAVLSILKNWFHFFEVNTVSVTLLLYLFCVVRMCIPIELPWVIIIGSDHIYVKIFKFFQMKAFIFYGQEITVNQIMLSIWLIVAVILFIRLLWKYYATYRIIQAINIGRYGKIVDEKYLEVFQENMKVKNKIYTVKTNVVQIPVCIGIIRKIILIPNKEYSDIERYYILKHEYTHHRNNDLLNQLLLNILCIIYWWNPFVYLLKKDMLLAFEVRCDEACTSGMDKEEITAYLETLLRVFKEKNNSAFITKNYLGILGECSDDRGEMVERFRILDNRINKSKKTLYGIMTILPIVLIGFFSYMFILQPIIQPTEEDCGISGENYLVEADDSYILHKKTGKYILVTNRGEEIDIKPDTITMLLDSGFEVVDE